MANNYGCHHIKPCVKWCVRHKKSTLFTPLVNNMFLLFPYKFNIGRLIINHSTNESMCCRS